MVPDYVTTKEAAIALSVTVQHVRRLVRTGKLAGQKRGRDWFVLRDSVERYKARAEMLPLPLQEQLGRTTDG